jgi:hypothetical protein
MSVSTAIFTTPSEILACENAWPQKNRDQAKIMPISVRFMNSSLSVFQE